MNAKLIEAGKFITGEPQGITSYHKPSVMLVGKRQRQWGCFNLSDKELCLLLRVS